MLQSLNLLPISLLCFMVSMIWPGQDFTGQGHYEKVKGKVKVTL